MGAEQPPDIDRILTIPTVTMTAPRPVLAGVAADMLISGETLVTPWVAAALSTDMEGMLARVIDKRFPKSGLGSSSFGQKADIVADTLALMEISLAALAGPRVPILGKVAVATTLGHEGFKAAWGINKARVFKSAGGGVLYVTPTNEGKCSMAEKMVSVGLAVIASDLDAPVARQAFSAASLAFALMGTARGEIERRKYADIADKMIKQLG